MANNIFLNKIYDVDLAAKDNVKVYYNRLGGEKIWQ